MNKTLPNKGRETSALHALGLISSAALAVVTLGTFIVAFFTPPISGPLSPGGGIKYPYLDIISRFPRDYYWMYPAMLLMLIFIVFLACADRYASSSRRIFSRIALLLGLLAAGIIFVDYFIQVSIVQPSLINGEHDGIPLLTQYNPHGIFIALEEAGYLLISLSILFLVPVVPDRNRVERAIRWIGVLSFVLTVISLAAIAAVYGVGREYRFEIAVISIDFIELILLGILWSILYKRAGRASR